MGRRRLAEPEGRAGRDRVAVEVQDRRHRPLRSPSLSISGSLASLPFPNISLLCVCIAAGIHYRPPPPSIGAPMALPTPMRSPISNICSRLAVLAPCAAPWLTLATSISDDDASSSSCSPVLVLAGAPHVYPMVTATDGLWAYQRARQETAQGRSQQGAWSMLTTMVGVSMAQAAVRCVRVVAGEDMLMFIRGTR